MCRSLPEAVRQWTVANNFKTNFTPKKEPKTSVTLWARIGDIDNGKVTVHRNRKTFQVENRIMKNVYTGPRGTSMVTLKPVDALQLL